MTSPAEPDIVVEALRCATALRAAQHPTPVDPRAIYRTRTVAVFEEGAAAIERLAAEVVRLRNVSEPGVDRSVSGPSGATGEDANTIECNAEIVGMVRATAFKLTGGNCAFADDDLGVLEHLAARAIDAGLTDGLSAQVQDHIKRRDEIAIAVIRNRTRGADVTLASDGGEAVQPDTSGLEGSEKEGK